VANFLPNGDGRLRTGGLRSASAALSQLSYIPLPNHKMGLGRVELPTSRLSGVRSNHLSYRPGGVLREKPKKFEAENVQKANIRINRKSMRDFKQYS
jgi:hypothetical protein